MTTCRFDSPALVTSIPGASASPTFAFDASNSNYFALQGSFTIGNVPGAPCTFPTVVSGTPYAITPYIDGRSPVRTFCKPLSGSTTYTAIECPSVTNNKLAPGPYYIQWTRPVGLPLTPALYVRGFSVVSPTPITDSVSQSLVTAIATAYADATVTDDCVAETGITSDTAAPISSPSTLEVASSTSSASSDSSAVLSSSTVSSDIITQSSAISTSDTFTQGLSASSESSIVLPSITLSSDVITQSSSVLASDTVTQSTSASSDTLTQSSSNPTSDTSTLSSTLSFDAATQSSSIPISDAVTQSPSSSSSDTAIQSSSTPNSDGNTQSSSTLTSDTVTPTSSSSNLLTSTSPSTSQTSSIPMSASSQSSSSTSTSQAQSSITVSSTATARPTIEISRDARCGPGYTCKGSKFGDCCSQYGWCGRTKDYCGNGCQLAFGTCSASASTLSTSTRPTLSSSLQPASPIRPSPTIVPTLKVSQDARCAGATKQTCKGSVFGDCCSQYGWCGRTSAYCNAGCQPGFGSCKNGKRASEHGILARDAQLGGAGPDYTYGGVATVVTQTTTSTQTVITGTVHVSGTDCASSTPTSGLPVFSFNPKVIPGANTFSMPEPLSTEAV
ncbi:hypothetical protein BDV95DRAFT_150887 [Massariosphaeria phaeospora]|uniref:Chitin-binding type-1 domain-containing protein n=1 Tax=Massariosphaeria phaeospora TaxID=100035 RepID=A0A7C8IH63_9PLEO|nr:hypothetical protein BDV95DRAFT_150887 [Massariosphaeria phaeospora]